jgi:hypothetical protein
MNTVARSAAFRVFVGMLALIAGVLGVSATQTASATVVSAKVCCGPPYGATNDKASAHGIYVGPYPTYYEPNPVPQWYIDPGYVLNHPSGIPEAAFGRVYVCGNCTVNVWGTDSNGKRIAPLLQQSTECGAHGAWHYFNGDVTHEKWISMKNYVATSAGTC